MSPDRGYSDLEIRILDRQDTGYPVELTLDKERQFARGFLDPIFLPWVDGDSPEADGERLFAWLFVDERLKLAWAAALGMDTKWRLRLRIDATAPELHTLPWELLRQPASVGSPALQLAADSRTPFSRYLALPNAPGKPIPVGRLKVLVAVADPKNLSEFGLVAINRDQELAALRAATADLPVDLVPLSSPYTLTALEAALRQDFHVLHFIGHGAYDTREGAAALYLANDDNRVQPVRADELRDMFGRLATKDSALRLVFLASCQTATTSPADAFQGLAPQLLRAGVPTVLAMQDLVPTPTARRFAQVFYHQLLQHGLVDLAGNQARSSVLAARLPGAAIPKVYMSLHDGQLLEVRSKEQPAEPAVEAAAPQSPAPQGRNILAVIGVDDYAQWPKLRTAVADANAVRECFVQQLGFVELTAPLLNSEATATRIRALTEDELPGLLAPDDSLVLFFAGHTNTETRRSGGSEIETGYLVPVDASSPQQRRLSTLIRVSTFLEDLAQLPARHVLVLLDARHNGGLSLGQAITAKRPGSGLQPDLTVRASRQVLTSARKDQIALESQTDTGLSLFASALVDALVSRKVDAEAKGFVTGSELALYLQRVVSEQSDLRQTPEFGIFDLDDRGEMVIDLTRGGKVSQAEPGAPPQTPAEAQRTYSVDLSQWITVGQVGQRGTTVAMSAVMAMEASLAFQGQPARLSAQYVYWRAKQRDNFSAAGTYLRVVTSIIEEFGAPPEVEWPYNLEAIAGNEGQGPPPDLEKLDRLAKRYRAKTEKLSSLDDIPRHLAAGRPVVASIRAYDDWYSDEVSKTGVLDSPGPDAKPIGGTCVVIVAYDQNDGVMRFANNWGTDWGDKGFGTMTQAAARELLDVQQLWAIYVPVPEPPDPRTARTQNAQAPLAFNEADLNLILEAVQSRNCVPFLGADIGTGVVSAQEMSRRLAGELGYAGPDLPLSEAAQRFELERSRKELVDRMLDWLTGALQPAPIHHLLAELPFSFFFTMAQHTLLEQALRAKGREVDVVVRQEDTAYIDATRTTVVKLLGDVGQPDRLVLTKRDRRGFLKQSPLLADFVKAKLATQTLLFLEYDLAGGELEEILSDVLAGQGRHRRTSYAIWPQPNAALQSYGAELNIRFIDSDSLAVLQALHGELSRRASQQPAGSVAAEVAPVMRRPFVFLDSFQAKDADLFAGRAREITTLSQTILAHRLVVLTGASGTGKTSLLQAGVGPRLGTAWRVITIRPFQDPLGETRRALQPLAPNLPPSASLSDLLLAAEAASEPRLVVVFDQFEELFLYSAEQTRQESVRQIAECITHADLDTRFVVSVRDDAFERLSAFDAQLPAIFHNTFILQPLAQDQAQLAVIEPLRRLGLDIDRDLLDQIVRELAQHKSDGQTAVDPSQLQIVLDQLYDEMLQRGDTRITQADYTKLGGVAKALPAYLRQTLVRRPEAKVVLEALVGEGGAKVQRSLDEISRQLPEGSPEPAPTLEALIGVRLVRPVRVGDVQCYELAHDVLAAAVWTWLNTLDFFSAPDVAPLRVYADGFQPDVPRGTGIELVTRKDNLADVVVRRDQEAFTVALPDGSSLLVVPIRQVDGSIDQPADLVPALVDLAKFRRVRTLQNPAQAQGSEASVRLDVHTGQDTGEPWVLTGQPVTLTITSNDERVLYVSLWLLSASGAVQKLYPARSDCDTLYPAASLSVSVVLELTQEAASEGALFKVFATEDPHDLSLLALDANPFASGDLLALGRPAKSAALSEGPVPEHAVIRILFLGASPSDTTRLHLDQESREIDNALRRAQSRDRFDFRQQWAVKGNDLQEVLLRYQPHIIHFSGHGSEAGEIILEDDAGRRQPVSPQALRSLFALFKDNIRCIVLNACFSQIQAEAIAESIDCVVGMPTTVGAEAAISFASAFYQALAYGRSVRTAFDLGCNQIDLESLGEQKMPQLLAQRADPSQVIFVRQDLK